MYHGHFIQFKFIIEEGVSLPVDPAFWDYLISTSQREWSLLVYEQDWLYVQFIRTKSLQVCHSYSIIIVQVSVCNLT